MSSSTRWRGRSDERDQTPSSPHRPSHSPISPSHSPVLDHHARNLSSTHSENSHAQGLGLFGVGITQQDSSSPLPKRLYIDSDGDAHLVGTRPRSTKNNNAKNSAQSAVPLSRQTPRSKKRKTHTRSGSTIDDLANAAIATSPRYDVASPNLAYNGGSYAVHATRPATSHLYFPVTNDVFFDRPAKRVKSEMVQPNGSNRMEERPRSSHVVGYQSPRPEEAELLLGLRYSIGAQASPSIPHMALDAKPLNEQNERVQNHESLDLGFSETVPVLSTTQAQAIAISEPIMTSQEASQHIRQERHELHQERHDDESRDAGRADHGPVADEDTAQNQPQNLPQREVIGENPDEVEHIKEEEIKPSRLPDSSLHTYGSKKPKKIRPEVQAEVCASCLKLQRDGSDEDHTTQWIGCEYCKKWFHAACVGFKDKQEARSVDKFYCKDCEGVHGSTTFVRKSSRVRTAIDYAGLNQGFVKPSDESSMHHYIQPIKDGRIKYLQDDFARIRPQLMTADFWEHMDGMKRPFVVPACWNPRFGIATDAAGSLNNIDGIIPSPEDDQCFDEDGQEIRLDDEAITSPGDQAQQEVIDTDQDYLDMVMPRHLTVRKVANLYGPEQPVPVIDVKSQETKGQFTLADWADYYEQPGDKPIRNVISLEVSNSRLGRMIRRPKVVRDIDLEDNVWDNETRTTSNKRPVQFYCLMSVADSYTDFHIDFGGSSVYYHILKGVKTFFFIPPEDKYLKKYEEWCNSDTQNDTWLGDLCGGNVTRVDLHEGDTAFIPAGWIHSVWTPEDSLVIGGNFLTRLDYELQLKVANIEKVTRVPQKFRYPFFQKVMWYALLKYMEDDPVPEEVLRDFHEDEEYRYLRANGIWMEDGQDGDLPEPGDPEFNARRYAKSELKGLPALREYLYRTARIHADLPVTDINKRQIDAVKGSIPKGHGDPMQLIKTFAVWCAWKIGNEKVPEWVHTDVGGLLPELKEMEKSRKAETFRVPPERTSTRKPKEVLHVSTIQEPVSPTAKSVHTPDSDDSARKRDDLKSLGSRIACEPCRKKRIKCRHKEGDVSPSSTSPAAIRPRTSSNVSTDIPKLAPASPVMNVCEPVLLFNATLPESNNSDLAQAALANLHSQSTDPSPIPQALTPSASAKKGRSKACEECRKSKRRCVHDEYGRVDPAKAAEPSKPRGSASAKRVGRSSDDHHHAVRMLRLEPDSDLPLGSASRSEITDAMIDPALMGDGMGASSYEQMYDPQFDALSAVTYMNDGITFSTINGNSNNIFESERLHSMGESSALPSQSHVDSGASSSDPHVMLPSTNSRLSPVPDNSFSPITVDEAPDITEEPGAPTSNVDSFMTTSRRSSHTPRFGENVADEKQSSSSKMQLKLGNSDDRSSSELSRQSIGSAGLSRRSSSNTSGTTHRAATATIAMTATEETTTGKSDPTDDLNLNNVDRPMTPGSVIGSEADADEKLARELQAAENGLRRRTSLRA